MREGVSRLVAPVALGLCAAWAFFLIEVSWPYQVDDAFILFRYGRHLREGLGLVWNPGEPPVEGYTNFVYVLLSAALPPSVEAIIVVKVLGLISFGGLLWLTQRLGQRLFTSSLEGRLAVMGLLVSPGLCFWAVAGLETTFFAALVAFAVLQFLKQTPRGDALAAVALFVAALSRTEGPVWAVLLLGLRLVLVKHPWAGVWSRVWPWLWGFFVPYGVFFLWRALYFHALVPNPVLFKSSLAVDGAEESVLWPFLETWWPWLALSLLGLFRLRHRVEARTLACVVLVAVPVFASAVTSAHGSSTVSFYDRYLLPFVPLVLLLAVEPLSALLRRSSLAGSALTLALLGWTSFNPSINPGEVGTRVLSWSEGVRPAVKSLTQFLQQERPSGYRVALGDVGFLGSRFHGAIDDVFGLNDSEYTRVLHGDVGRWTKALLSRHPDGFVLVMREDEGPLRCAHVVDQAIFDSSEFRARYQRVRDFQAGRNPWKYVLFERTATP